MTKLYTMGAIGFCMDILWRRYDYFITGAYAYFRCRYYVKPRLLKQFDPARMKGEPKC